MDYNSDKTLRAWRGVHAIKTNFPYTADNRYVTFIMECDQKHIFLSTVKRGDATINF